MLRFISKQGFILTLFFFFFSAIGTAASLPPGFSVLTGGKILLSQTPETTVPFTVANRQIFVKVKINDSATDYTFLLDTGSPTMIDEGAAQELGLKTAAETEVKDLYGTTQKIKIMTMKSMKVGGTGVQNLGAMTYDFKNLRSYGLTADGILGCNFLKFYTVRLDYENQTVTFFGKQANQALNISGYRVKLTSNPLGLIFAKLAFERGSAIDVEVDTGSGGECYVNFPAAWLETLKPALSGRLVSSNGMMSSAAFGGSKSWLARLAVLHLGDFQARNVPVEFTEGNVPLLTNKFLSHFIVIINYSASEMVLIPNERRPFETNVASFGFMPRKDDDGTIRIAGVWEGSPADRNGMKPGDVITRIESAGSGRFEDLIKIMVSNAVALTLRVRNESGEKEILLQREPLLPLVE